MDDGASGAITAAIAAARALDWRDPVFREQTEYATYRQLHTIEPQRSDVNGEWHFVRYRDCREAFQSPLLFSNDFSDTGGGQSNVIPENSDGAAHREYRRLLDPMFHPKLMDELVPAMRTFARELLTPLTGRDRCDIVAEFTMPFPTITFCRLMGFPISDHPTLMRWKDIYLNSTSPLIADRLGVTERDDRNRPTPAALAALVGEATAQISAYLMALIEARRSRPEDDLLTRLVSARRVDGNPFTDTELMQISFNLFLGGLDTVTGLLSFVVRDFALRPDRRAAFTAIMHDDRKVTTAVEELVRLHSIVSIPRRVIHDHDFHGAALRAGDVVQVMTPGADRDPARFDDPDELDLARSPNPHLGFGLGVHRCLGIHLARREIAVALRELHEMMPDYTLDPEHPAQIGSGGVRGLLTLPLRLS
ncbi:MAG: cytochrome P450 [Acidimicrobiia bacterium]